MERTKTNIFSRLVNYFGDVKSEMKKVVWPTFAKVRQNTITVIVYVLIVGVIICGLDWLFTWLMSFMFNR